MSTLKKILEAEKESKKILATANEVKIQIQNDTSIKISNYAKKLADRYKSSMENYNEIRKATLKDIFASADKRIEEDRQRIKKLFDKNCDEAVKLILKDIRNDS